MSALTVTDLYAIYSPPLTFSFKKVLLGHFVAQWCVTVFLVLDVSSVDTQHIPSTPILGLWHSVFTDQFIFRLILGHFFPTSYTFYATGETRSITSHISCNTKNVICMVQCNRCNLQYIGET